MSNNYNNTHLSPFTYMKRPNNVPSPSPLQTSFSLFSPVSPLQPKIENFDIKNENYDEILQYNVLTYFKKKVRKDDLVVFNTYPYKVSADLKKIFNTDDNLLKNKGKLSTNNNVSIVKEMIEKINLLNDVSKCIVEPDWDIFQKAASIIQAHWRGYVKRKEFINNYIENARQMKNIKFVKNYNYFNKKEPKYITKTELFSKIEYLTKHKNVEHTPNTTSLTTTLGIGRLTKTAGNSDKIVNAAIRIQSDFRGHYIRHYYKKYQNSNIQATKIQALWRGYITRKKYELNITTNSLKKLCQQNTFLIENLYKLINPYITPDNKLNLSLYEEKINYLNKQITKLTQDSAKQATDYEKHINQLVKERQRDKENYQKQISSLQGEVEDMRRDIFAIKKELNLPILARTKKAAENNNNQTLIKKNSVSESVSSNGNTTIGNNSYMNSNIEDIPKNNIVNGQDHLDNYFNKENVNNNFVMKKQFIDKIIHYKNSVVSNMNGQSIPSQSMPMNNSLPPNANNGNKQNVPPLPLQNYNPNGKPPVQRSNSTSNKSGNYEEFKSNWMNKEQSTSLLDIFQGSSPQQQQQQQLQQQQQQQQQYLPMNSSSHNGNKTNNNNGNNNSNNNNTNNNINNNNNSNNNNNNNNISNKKRSSSTSNNQNPQNVSSTQHAHSTPSSGSISSSSSSNSKNSHQNTVPNKSANNQPLPNGNGPNNNSSSNSNNRGNINTNTNTNNSSSNTTNGNRDANGKNKLTKLNSSPNKLISNSSNNQTPVASPNPSKLQKQNPSSNHQSGNEPRTPTMPTASNNNKLTKLNSTPNHLSNVQQGTSTPPTSKNVNKNNSSVNDSSSNKHTSSSTKSQGQVKNTSNSNTKSVEKNPYNNQTGAKLPQSRNQAH